MRILAFDKSGVPTLAVRRDNEIVDLSVALPDLPQDMPGLLGAGSAALESVARVAKEPPSGSVLSAADLVYHPPVWNPDKIICVGLNYADHAAETGMEKPEYPILFIRVSSSVVGHEQPLIKPKYSDQFDYEAELVAVIGTAGRHIPASQALDHVAGYSIFNEGSIRDYQFRSQTWTSGKNFDASGSFGPDVITSDEVPPGGAGLRIQTRLNGETVQDSNTQEFIFDVPTLIEAISEIMTLAPGDIIVTGTPPGVGLGRTPPLWMKPGDVCEVEIEGLGTLRNPVAVG